MVQVEAPMAELWTMEVVEKMTCEKFLEWEIKAASHYRKGKYEVAPKSAVFKSFETENR